MNWIQATYSNSKGEEWTFLCSPSGNQILNRHMREAHEATMVTTKTAEYLILNPGGPIVGYADPFMINLGSLEAVVRPEHVAKMIYLLQYHHRHTSGYIFFPTEAYTAFVSEYWFNTIRNTLTADLTLAQQVMRATQRSAGGYSLQS